MSVRIGVDIGGTFTDFCVYDEKTRALRTLKVPSTPDTPGAEVLAGMRLLQERDGIAPEDVVRFVHGTTVGINTVIQRKGMTLALFVTEGFADVLELARLRMPEAYSMYSMRPTPLIPRHRVFQIKERMLSNASVAVPIDRANVLEVLADAKASGAEGIVVSFLHAYRNPVNEQLVRDIVAEVDPDLPVYCSSLVWPVIREYERTVTTILAGYVQERVALYLGSLQRALRDHGTRCEPMITKSNGGIMSAENGKRDSVHLLLSGTASGVIGASFIADSAGIRNLLTLDIGGTSADVALIIDGKPQRGTGELIGEFPLYVPTISVSSIGEGGGSIAWLDEQGGLKVGPESAGASPGPACYGKGGMRPTITDAFAVCGLLGGAPLGYNSITIDKDKAAAAIATITPQGVSLETRAQAIIDVAVSGMYLGISKMIARSGIDIRDFTLMTFGGAGPMLGCFLARELGMRRVLVPATPGVISALGGLVADVKNDFLEALYAPMTGDIADRLRIAAESLRSRAKRWLLDEEHYEGEPLIHFSADMHYRGQSYEIEVPIDNEWLMEGDTDAIVAAFHKHHQLVYDIHDPEGDVRIVNLRALISGEVPKPQLGAVVLAKAAPAPDSVLSVYLDGAMQSVPCYRRSRLAAGHRLSGPAIIIQDDTTTCIPVEFEATVDAYGNMLLDWTNGSGE
ncbi:hydantoinase/oxoprolinase family protein [Mesorhizobium sp. M0968]|uniref:hydantoinase/oxoprolinase family protein n=1 Tax=Mesorhizobium sp. M0968 TaxID=2957037 RepID=UPI003338E062